MEQIIEFMDAYWGVTVFGTVTVGTLITFSVLMARMIIKEKSNNVLVNLLMDKVADALKAKDSETYEKAQVVAENEYLQKSMALTFKYLNYLTVASKLDGAQKIELVEDAKALQDGYALKLVEIAAGVFEAEGDIIEKLEANKNPIIEIIEDATEVAASLLDKYTVKEG
jgi:hypothetical protein